MFSTRLLLEFLSLSSFGFYNKGKGKKGMKQIGVLRIAVKFELANKFSIPVMVESLNLPRKS